MEKPTRNPINENQNRIWNWLPLRLRNDANYQAFVEHIHQREEYDFFMTINFKNWQPDTAVIQSTSHLLKVLNRSLSSKTWKEKGRYIEGFAFLERHVKSKEREGSLHVHILGYFPNTFYKIPTEKQFESKLIRASTKVTTPRGKPMINIGEVDVRIPHDKEGLVNYLSKKLTRANLQKRTLLLDQNGLSSWEPLQEKFIENRYRPNDLFDSKHQVSEVKTISGRDFH